MTSRRGIPFVFVLAIGLVPFGALEAGDGVWTTSYPHGGRFDSGALAVDPSNPATVYAHPLWRGIYRSTDSGASWSPRLDDVQTPFDSKHLRSVTVDPAGDLYAIACCGAGGEALWRSPDGGTSWSDADGGVAGDVSAFAIAPGDPNVRYLGTQQGPVYVSTDGGASWSAAGAGLPADGIRSLEVDPTDANTVWAGTASNGVYKTTDGGASWNGANGDVVMTRVDDIAIDPTAPDTVYAAEAFANTIFKTTNGGTNWMDLGLGGSFGGQAGRLIAIDPGDPTHLFAVANNEILESTDAGLGWSPSLTAAQQMSSVQFEPGSSLTLYATGWGDGILKSADGGDTWNSSHAGILGLGFPHTKGHSLAFDASDATRIYAGSMPSSHRSIDGGASWIDIGQNLGQPWSFVSHPGAPGTVHALTSDHWLSTDGGVTWNLQGASPGGFGDGDLVVHPGDSQTLYLGGHGSGSSPSGVHRSTDGGANWTLMNNGLSNTNVRALAIDPNDGNTLFAGCVDDGGGAAVFKTTDGGANWSQLGGGLPASFHPNEIVLHPMDSNLVFLAAEAGGGGGGVWRSQDGGGTWQQLIPDNGAAVAVNPNSTNGVYFGTWNTSGFWRSLDGGNSWALLTAGLPVNPAIDAIAVDPSNTNRILLGTAGGAYEIDLGAGTLELTVTNSDDGGPGSLRDALVQASQDGLPTAIRFAPWMAGATIVLGSPLPGLDGATDLDGDVNDDCLPDVAIDGQWMPDANGLHVNGDGNRVAGLAIHSFDCPGCGGDLIVVGFTGQPSNNNLIECNFLGTDHSGAADLGTQTFAIKVYGGSAGNLIRSNRIVFNGTGIQFLEGSSDNVVGPGNEIAFSDGPGVHLVDGIDERYPDFAGLVGDPIQVFPVIDFTDDGGSGPFRAGATVPIDSNGNTFHDAFGMRLTGSVNLDTAGSYTFDVDHDDSARLVVDGIERFDNGCCGGSSATVTLAAGDTPIELDFREHPGAAQLRLTLSGPGTATLNTNGNTGGCAAGQAGLCGELFQLRIGSDRNTITQNSVHDNGGLGINLGDDGVTPNDPGDTDIGPNTLLNSPEVTLITDNGGDNFTVDGVAPPDSTVEIFAAQPDPSGFVEGDQYLISVVADPAGNFSGTFDRPGGFYAVTTTATDTDGNTSEFSSRSVLTPNTPVVTSTSDSGPGSLREAIHDANSDGVPTVITFDPGLAGQTIFVLSQLPDLTESDTTIDGDFDADCDPDVEISGALAGGGADGLAIRSANNVIRGLAFVDFDHGGLYLAAPETTGNLAECNHFGVHLDGSPGGNGRFGIYFAFGDGSGGASDNTLGPANVIAFNGEEGIFVADSSNSPYPDFSGFGGADAVEVFTVLDFDDSDDRFFTSIDGITPTDGAGSPFSDDFDLRLSGTLNVGTPGNYLLTLDADNQARLVVDGGEVLAVNHGEANVNLFLNGAHGIEVDYHEHCGGARLRVTVNGPGAVGFSTDGAFGGACAGGQPGLCGELFRTRGATERNRITQNSIFDNGRLGITLDGCGSGGGAIPNDTGDLDVGANGWLNHPEFTNVTDHGGGSFTLEGTAPPGAIVELFGAAPDPSGFGEGKLYLDSAVADGAGTWALTVALPVEFYAVTATATDPAGNTSEFSPVSTVKTPDEVTVGNAAAFQGETAMVPIYVRDLAATPLGIDRPVGDRIQAFTVQVRFSPAASVASIAGARAGLTTGLTPLFENTTVFGDTATYIVSYEEASNPIPLTLDAAAPGDQVARFEVTLSPTAAPTAVTLSLVPAGTVLSNQGGTIEETQPDGSLNLFDGAIGVLTRAATALSATPLSPSSVRLTWTDPNADETGFRIERSPDGAGWATVATVGPDTTEYTDGSLAPAALYYYRVISFSGAGDNLPSNVAWAVTFPATATRACVQPASFLDHGWARFADVDHNGSLWGTVRDEKNGGTNSEIFFQFLNAGGAPAGASVPVSKSDMQSQFPSVVWNGSRFGVFWSEHMRGPLGAENRGVNLFSLFDGNGQPLRERVRLMDDTPLGGLNSDAEFSFAWDGAGWGHVAVDMLDATTTDVHLWRFQEDGDPLLGPVNVSNSSGDIEQDTRIAWSGAEYGIVWIRKQGGTEQVLFQRRNPDGSPPAGDPPPVELWASTPGDVWYTDLVWNGGGWAVVWVVFPSDVDESAVYLRLLDPDGTPQGPAKRLSDTIDAQKAQQGEPWWPVYDEVPKLMWTGAGYLCFTSSWTGASFAYEIGVLEADAAGNRVEYQPGLARKIVSDIDGWHSIFQRAASDGASYLAVYNDARQGSQEISSVRTAADGTVLEGPHDLSCCHSPGNAPVFGGAGSAVLGSLAGGGFVGLWTDEQSGIPQIYARLFDASGAPSATLAPLSGRQVRGFAGLAAVGDSFAVAWKDGADNVVFTRLDTNGNQLVGEVEVAAGATGRAHVTADFSGEAYGLLYQDGDGLVLLRVDPAGNPQGPKTIVSPSVWGWPPPRVVWAGSGWAILWRGTDHNLHYALVDPFGGIAVADTTLTGSGMVTSWFTSHWSGERLGIAWREDRGIDPPGLELYFTVLNLDGTFAIPEVMVQNAYFSGGRGPHLYWQGDRFHLLRGSSTNVDGVWEDEILPDGTLFPDVRQHTNRGFPDAIAFDGATLGLLWGQFRSDLFFQTSECLADASAPVCPEVSVGFGDDGVSLSWPAVNDPESGIWRYLVYRDGVQLAELFDSTTQFTDAGYRAGEVHTYAVRALNAAYAESAGCPAHTFSTTVGDPNGDGVLDVADIFYLINFFFAGGPPPMGDADANGDGEVTIADIFYLINFFFGGGPAPASMSPGPAPSTAILAGGGPADVLALGSGATVPKADVIVPITVRDVSATPLDEGDGANAEIQGYALRVDFSPASAVSRAAFRQAGVTEGKTAVLPVVSVGSGFVYALLNFHETANPLSFGLDAPAPGDLVGELRLTVDSAATPGEVQLRIDPATATLVNGDARVSETPAKGSLQVVDGFLTVLDPGAGCVAHVLLSNQTEAGTATFEGCQSVTAGDGYLVASPGVVTFRAGEQIVLENGFSVDGDGRFTAELDPALNP